MRRYEPKPWDIRRCDMIHADEGEYVLYCDAQTEIERLTKERDEARAQVDAVVVELKSLVSVVQGYQQMPGFSLHPMAANAYMTIQYGIAALGHPVDRQSILDEMGKLK